MDILAYNAGHDGSAVLISDGRLAFALEAEKDSGSRHAYLTPDIFVRSFQKCGIPDVVAVSGWHRRSRDFVGRTEAGYLGIADTTTGNRSSTMAGNEVRLFHSSHERSHILCSYALSPYPQGQPCYVLVWEGKIGSFYLVDESITIHKIMDVIDEPGSRYCFLYGLADPTVPMFPTWLRMEDAGKLMALAAYGTAASPSEEEAGLIEAILTMPGVYSNAGYKAHKARFKGNSFCNIGVESQAFKDLARRFSDALFDRFFHAIRPAVMEKLPLLISGGCGLNCEWNSRWSQCGLFSDVFVPPCTNDSGVSLGAGVDAMRRYTGKAKLEWSVYAGEEFIEDSDVGDLRACPLDLADVSARLAEGAVIAWVQGRYEMGPRALGNRSLLAAPFREETRDRLNKIKQRESFRPIAPVCLQEDFDTHFAGDRSSSPYMLYFQRVKSATLAAVTHVDMSARAQTVTESENPKLHALLRSFKAATGCGVLCNTSLNFKGSGFINRMSDLVEYARERALDGIVVGDTFFALS